MINNLFIVGAQRSGSTYLYEILDSHPEICMAHPVRPEPKFFMSDVNVSMGKRNYEKAYFSDKKLGARYFGEKSTSYFESPLAATRIQSFYPNARILIILRNPVLRAYSNYRFSVSHNLEKLSFEEALQVEHERFNRAEFSTSVSPYSYFSRGLYIDFINSYLDIFDANQLHVMIFEEFVGNLFEVQRLYQWLGISHMFIPPTLYQTINPSLIKGDEQGPIFCKLLERYRDSIQRLENLLGRRIEAWDHGF